jgi:C4-dicarboxylate-specific signal transduction histidine kinase
MDGEGPAQRAGDYLLAAALAVAALLLRALLPIAPGVGLYPLPLSAIIVSAWRGGRGPGLLATLVSSIGITGWFLWSQEAFTVDTSSVLGFAIFVAVGVLATEFSMARRRAAEALRRSEAQAEQERERLRQAQADLERINRVSIMGELAASLAHEIRQPIAAALTNARTCVRWLERPEPDLAEARAAASRAADDTTRAAEIITRLRSLFQKAPPRREVTDVNAVVGQMVTMLRGEAQRHAVSIRIVLAHDLPTVKVDGVQLRQVLLNLIANAVDAMKGSAPPRVLVVRTRRVEDGCQVSVVDTGPGLPPEQAERIFDAFFTTKPDGTGLGLPISRSIVESHGGRLWTEPGDDRGAAFHFTLPGGSEAEA